MKAQNVLKLNECVEELGLIYKMCKAILNNTSDHAFRVVCAQVEKLYNSLNELLQEVAKTE